MKPIQPPEIEGTKATVFGVGQPEYLPLPARVNRSGRVITEWELDTADHMAVAAAGPDIDIRVRVHQLTGNGPLQPLRVELVIVPNKPEEPASLTAPVAPPEPA